MRPTLALALALATLAFTACKRDDDAKPAPGASAPPPSARDAGPPQVDAMMMPLPAPPLTPAIPPGTIGLQVIDVTYGGFVAQGLPAIKGDGSMIAVVAVADDGGRGYLDLEARVLDASGKVVKAVRVADPNQADPEEPAAGAPPSAANLATKAAVAEVNAWFAAGDWRALPGSEPIPPSDDLDAELPVTYRDLTFRLEVRKQLVTIRRGDAKVASHKLTRVYPVPGKPDADAPCNDEQPYLSAVHVDDAAAKVVLTIGFVAGGHNCGARGPVHAIVPLPK